MLLEHTLSVLDAISESAMESLDEEPSKVGLRKRARPWRSPEQCRVGNRGRSRRLICGQERCHQFGTVSEWAGRSSGPEFAGPFEATHAFRDGSHVPLDRTEVMKGNRLVVLPAVCLRLDCDAATGSSNLA
jgi:hypothetical protein